MTERITFSISNLKEKVPPDDDPKGPLENKTVAGFGSSAQILNKSDGINRAIVFIHGFTGDVYNTWQQFLPLINNDSRFNDADIFFYGYDSVGGQLGTLAQDFRFFLRCLANGVLTKRAFSLDACDAEPRHLMYKEIIVAAHSEGGPVTRQAIIYAANRKEPWVKRCRLILFAPAHCGARIQGKVKKFLAAFPAGQFIIPWIEYYVPAETDLDPHKSTFLPKLREDTEALAATSKEPTPNAFRARCVFGTKDLIVITDHFKYDTRSNQEGQTHTSICKPKPDWLWPLDFILPPR